MSLFRKPKKIQRRVVSSEKEDEDKVFKSQDEEPTKKLDYDENTEFANSKTNKEKSAPKALLSFADDEDDAEVFQVRKSSQSKKMMRMLGKERRRKDRIDSKVHSSTSSSSSSIQTKSIENHVQTTNGSKNNIRSRSEQEEDTCVRRENPLCKEIRTEDLVLVVKQVNPETQILNGRAALCAGRDDMSDENDSNDGETNNYAKNHRFSKPEKIKEMLESGTIPDAAMIHAARKRRQKARELGEYIPINDKEEMYQRKSNLENEDEEDDHSDDERINMNAITGQKEQEERRQQFLSAEENCSGDDSDQELHKWENQQLRKGVTGAQLINSQQGQFLTRFIMKSEKLTPHDDNKPLSTSTLLEKAYAKNSLESTQKYLIEKDAKSNASKASALQTPQQIQRALKSRLLKIKELNERHTNEIVEMKQSINKLRDEFKDSTKRGPEAAKKYRFHQELKYFINDLVDCLNEKLPSIIELEQRYLQIYAKRQTYLIERRRQDVRDQTKEIVGATTNLRNESIEERIKRAAERECRRTRRRCDREKLDLSCSHLDGTSSDDEISDTLLEKFQLDIEKIGQDMAGLCDDIVEDFYKINLVLNKFLSWRNADQRTYNDSFVSLFLPKILGPLIRIEMITWSPVQENYREIEKMNWYSFCMLYASTRQETIESLKNDNDTQLVPSIIEKIVLPKLNDIISHSWDPLSTTQTLRLIGFIKRITRDYPLRENSKALQQLFKLILEEMKTTLESDVFIPIFPKQIQEAKTSFFQRQFCSSLKLFRNYLSWQGIIADKHLIELTITLLLNRYMLLAMRVCSVNDAVVKACHIVNTLPSVWLQKDSEALKNLEIFIDFVKSLHEKCDVDVPVLVQCREDARLILQKVHAL